MENLIPVLLPDEQIGAFLNACERLRQLKTANLKANIKYRTERLAKLQRASAKAKERAQALGPEDYYYSSADEQRDQDIAKLQMEIDDEQNRLKALEANEELPIPYLPCPFAVGDVGSLFQDFEVVQVVDEQSAIVHGSLGMTIPSETEDDAGFPFEMKEEMALLRGIDTRRWADGDTYGFDPEKHVFACTGTYRYSTPFGSSSTIRVLELFDLDKAKKTWIGRKNKV